MQGNEGIIFPNGILFSLDILFYRGMLCARWFDMRQARKSAIEIGSMSLDLFDTFPFSLEDLLR